MKRLLVSLLALGAIAGSAPLFSGANFVIQTSNPQTVAAATDFVAPTVTASAIATTASGNPLDGPGFVRQGGTYRIYANVTDAGNPASGVASVTADLTSVSDGGHSAVTLSPGSFTVGGVTYRYASAEQTASNPLTEGSKAYSVTASDSASNSSAPATFHVTVDDTAPTVSLTNPTSSSDVRDGITPSATATDSNGIASVKIQRSPAGANTWTDVCTITTGPGSTYSCSFNTATIGDGLYDFRAVATDSAGNSANSTAATGVRVDNTPPAVTMANPGSPLSGTITLSLSSATDTGGSGVASVKYQVAPTGTTSWSDACTGTSGPTFSCSFDTTTLNDGGYDFRAIATDNAGNTGTSATIAGRQISNPLVGVMFDATNCKTCILGEADTGDTISFTYSRPMDPGSIVPATTNPAQPAWDGTSARNVKVTLNQGGNNDTLTEVQLDVGNTTVSLGTVALGANYLTGSASSFAPSPIVMSNGGKTFTITLGTFAGSGSLQQVTAPPTPSVVWTPSASAHDLLGNPVSTTPVTRSFLAF